VIYAGFVFACRVEISAQIFFELAPSIAVFETWYPSKAARAAAVGDFTMFRLAISKRTTLSGGSEKYFRCCACQL
jgi:hypothetical protein